MYNILFTGFFFWGLFVVSFLFFWFLKFFLSYRGRGEKHGWNFLLEAGFGVFFNPQLEHLQVSVLRAARGTTFWVFLNMAEQRCLFFFCVFWMFLGWVIEAHEYFFAINFWSTSVTPECFSIHSLAKLFQCKSISHELIMITPVFEAWNLGRCFCTLLARRSALRLQVRAVPRVVQGTTWI